MNEWKEKYEKRKHKNKNENKNEIKNKNDWIAWSCADDDKNFVLPLAGRVRWCGEGVSSIQRKLSYFLCNFIERLKFIDMKYGIITFYRWGEKKARKKKKSFILLYSKTHAYTHIYTL